MRIIYCHVNQYNVDIMDLDSIIIGLAILAIIIIIMIEPQVITGIFANNVNDGASDNVNSDNVNSDSTSDSANDITFEDDFRFVKNDDNYISQSGYHIPLEQQAEDIHSGLCFLTPSHEEIEGVDTTTWKSMLLNKRLSKKDKLNYDYIRASIAEI